MSDIHSGAQNEVCGILEWYGFRSDAEYHVDNGSIDCVAFGKNSSKPFMGIEVHIQGNLDTDLKKLLGSKFLTHRVILTPDGNLMTKMSQSMPDISWFPLPSKDDHSFENYIRSLPEAIKRDKYWYEGKETVVVIQSSNDPLSKFEELLKENRLNVELSERIIYTFAVAGGSSPKESKGMGDTNEYKFLMSLGILQGLELYWYDMEWGDRVKYTYERAEVPNVTQTRKMRGEPLAYIDNKAIINSVVKSYIEDIMHSIGKGIDGYSETFCEVALMGRKGDFRPYEQNFTPYSWLSNHVEPVEQARLDALVANPFISARLWEFGKEIVKNGLGVIISDDLIKIPYKTVAEVFGFSGKIKEKEDEVNEYLAWWILYRGGVFKESMMNESNLLGVPWDMILQCVDETFSKNLTSRYIQDTTGIHSMSSYLESKGGQRIGGISDITVYRQAEFESYCSRKMQDSLSNIL